MDLNKKLLEIGFRLHSKWELEFVEPHGPKATEKLETFCSFNFFKKLHGKKVYENG